MQLDRRRFIERLGRAGLGLGALSGFARFPSVGHAKEAHRKPLQVCLVSGSNEYKSNETLAAFQGWAEQKFAVKCSRAFWKSKSELPGLDALSSCDVMLLFTRRLEPPADQLELIKKYCLAGRPIVGVRTASHAFQKWLELDRLVFGGDYQGHFNSGPITKVTIASGTANHPVLKGVGPFESPSTLYKNPHIADDTQLLLNGSIPEHTEPVAWTRKNHGGKVFYTSLGSPADFQKQEFKTLLANALFWTADRSPAS